MHPKISRVIPKNLSVYWVLCTSLAVWFLFIHSPPILRDRFGGHALAIFYKDPPFAYHLLGAYTIYLACIHNTLLTPSCLNGHARKYHVYVGRIGMIAGVIGFLLGLYCAWSPTRPGHDQGFAIGITIGGAMQIMAQAVGYVSIRKYQRLKREVDDLTSFVASEGGSGDEIYYGSLDEDGNGTSAAMVQMQQSPSTKLEQLTLERDDALKMHIKSMLGLFVVACGVPASIRIAESVAFLEAMGDNAIWVSIGVLNVMALGFERVYLK